MHQRFSRIRASGGLVVARPPLPILTAGTGSPTANIGYSSNTVDFPGSPFGALNNLNAPGGRTIISLAYEVLSNTTYLVLAGTGHVAFMNGLPIWINGTGYTCSAATATAANTYATVSVSQLFVTPNTYTVSFVAP